MPDKPTFSHPRYATRGVVDEIDSVLQQELWLMVEMLVTHTSGEKVDYLQVFDLQPAEESGYFNQSIIHSQEQPPYRATTLTHVKTPVSAKVFVIDDVIHCTMLLAQEY